MAVPVTGVETLDLRRQVQVPIDYVGHVIDQGFLVGYGMDFDEKYRGLPEVYEIET